jgi:hypothetical protein
MPAVVAEHGGTCGRLSVVASEGGQARTTKEVVVLCQLELDGRGGGRGATEEEEEAFVLCSPTTVDTGLSLSHIEHHGGRAGGRHEVRQWPPRRYPVPYAEHSPMLALKLVRGGSLAGLLRLGRPWPAEKSCERR